MRLLLLASLALGQDLAPVPPEQTPVQAGPGQPQAQQPPAESPAPVAPADTPAASTAAPAGQTPMALVEKPVRVRVHKEAKEWEPIAVRVAGDPHDRNHFRYNLKTEKKKLVGPSSAAKATARVIPSGEDRLLIIAVFPKKLKDRRVHLELRFLIVEGYLEKAEVFAITAEAGAGANEDSWQLRARGIPFQSEAPSEGEIRLGAIDAKPGPDAFNSGSLRGAAFVEYGPTGFPGLGHVSLDYSVRGVVAAKRKAKGKT